MSNNVQPIFAAQPEPPEKAEHTAKNQKHPAKKRRWLLFLAVFLLILALLVAFLLTYTTALDGMKRFFRYLGTDETQYGDIVFETYGTSSYALFDGRLAVATQNGLTVFQEDGSTLAQLKKSFTTPALEANSERLLVYDIGGDYAAVMDADGALCYEQATAGLLYDAALSESGSCALLYAGSDSRSVLEIYDKNGTLVYRRNAKSHYLNACALSPDGATAAASTLEQETLEFCASVQLLRTNQEEVAAVRELDAELAYDLAFLSDDTLCVVGEKSLYFLDADGALLGQYTQANGTLTDYCMTGDGFCAAYALYSGTCQLVLFDDTGSAAVSVELPDAPVHLSACESYVAVLSETELCIYDGALELRSQTENAGYSHAFVRADGTALCVSSGKAELYIP